MAQSFELAATVRSRVGKGAARALRREGKIPAVIYGDKQQPLAIELSEKEVSKNLYGGGFLTNITVIDVDGKKHRTLARDFQLEPVRDFLLHVDFLRVSANTVIAVEVPVHFSNEEESPGLKRGGVLNVVRHTVELECPADAIPDFITVDLTGSDIGDSLHISAVKLPAKVTPTITDRDFTIATIAAPAVMPEEEDAAAEAEAAEAAEAEDAGEAEAEGEAGDAGQDEAKEG